MNWCKSIYLQSISGIGDNNEL